MTDNAPEPGARLYAAVRDLGLLTNGWGPWDSLSPAMQSDLAREEYCLVREVGPPAVAEAPAAVDHEHEWHCAAFRHDCGWFFCSRCLEVRRVPMHG